MNGLRKAYLKLGDEKRGEDLIRTYTRVGWSELKKGDVVVLLEPNGESVDDGAEHHLISDPWFEPDLHLHVIKTADPVRVIHKEATHGQVPEQAGAGAQAGADQEGIPVGPRPLHWDNGGEVSRVFKEPGDEGQERGAG